MIEIDPNSLIDHATINTATANLEAARAKLAERHETLRRCEADVSAAWDAARKSNDPLAGAEDHARAIARRDMAARMIAEAETDMETATQSLANARAIASMPIAAKAKELRLAGARAADVAKAALAKAEALFQQGTRLAIVARQHGVLEEPAGGFRGPVPTELVELSKWDS